MDVAPLAGAWIEIQIKIMIMQQPGVAPLAGAWIEISMTYPFFGRLAQSLPSRERGLKFYHIGVFKKRGEVAPLAGAWIEIYIQEPEQPEKKVAPLAGAWIEIIFPHWTGESLIQSLPSRERGLKSVSNIDTEPEVLSLPSRERGLKSCRLHKWITENNVAPLAGAWIEIKKKDCIQQST